MNFRGFTEEYSSCSFIFSEEHLMNEFVSKYKDFKIYNEKNRMYPLHIEKAMYFDCEPIAEEGKKSKTGSNDDWQQLPEYLEFMA